MSVYRVTTTVFADNGDNTYDELVYMTNDQLAALTKDAKAAIAKGDVGMMVKPVEVFEFDGWRRQYDDILPDLGE